MAQRPGFPPAKKPSSSASISSAHCNNILRNFRQEDVVFALMTQLREKESELTILVEQRQVSLRQQTITEQSNQQLKSKVELHNKAVAEKDTKIALLEQKLAQEKKGNGSAIAEANLKHITETNAECKRILKERDDELSQLRPIMKHMKSTIGEYEKKDSIQHTEKLVEELAKVKGELAIAKDQNTTSDSTIEQLEKKVKGKEWMIKSLHEDSGDQRSRENHLLAYVKNLNDKIDIYETKFKGKDVDVPMLLAKLKDYEVRTKDLQGQVRRLTNKKLNELVLRSLPIPHEIEETKKPNQQVEVDNQSEVSEPVEVDNQSEVSENSSYIGNSEQDMDEEGTLDSNGTDEMDDIFSPKSALDEDVLGDFLSDVKVGIETLEMESLCCSHRPSSIPSYYRDHRSPDSRNSSRTAHVYLEK
mmetsp:Transcript_2957/g.6411  ORF Transcript_2957/g.6411 Transcript_2957/m.6411 type:complete len:417 (+) Transcript_2957:204-1454(+)|eukprot:CAMPEP_0172315354 /NCGR_PEP_ID=MMETSP1058-20130122/24953_1 /TAXON_ID=83371 /ORGANISM="Detonula confervacea, Strain CCMP 353" /LENGTH=416 /DNA_ID=CAMNT_0013029425 /DNA_START=119 /DNA_END=1369 /DNA_ORIENTATION=+